MPVFAPLAKGEENFKICGWGCLTDKGLPSLLTSDRHFPLSVLADFSTLHNHMAGFRSCKRCTQIPFFVKSALSKREFRTVQPIRHIIEIYFRVTREAKSSKTGCYTALRAAGVSLNSRYNDFQED